MGILCLGTYFKVLMKAVSNNTQKVFISNYYEIILQHNYFDNSDSVISKLAGGFINPTKEMMDKSFEITSLDFDRIVDGYKNNVLPMFEPNKLSDAIRILSVIIAEDKDIKDDTIIDIISGLKKRELSGKADNPSEFLIGLFLYVIRYTDNSRPKDFVKKTVKEFTEKAADYVFRNVSDGAETVSENDIREQEIKIYNEKSEQKAISFCLKNESDKDLIPLCQIVAVTNPNKSHLREMFNEYCLFELSTQKRILEINEIPVINVTSNDWWEECLERFCLDYKKYNLGNDRYLYSFNQYFHRLINYANEPIIGYLERVFSPTVINPVLIKNPNLDIPDLVDEYIYYKDSNIYKDKLEPPMDFLWRELDLGSCDESGLVIVLALFIIGACRTLPKAKGVVIEKPSLRSIKTAEDLFYMTLLFLYEKYMMN